MDEPLPPELRDHVTRTLRPVRPLRSPTRRALALLPVAAMVLGAVPLLWGIRYDTRAVGPPLLWVGSVLQIGVALALIATALAESIPGRLSGPSSLAARAAIGLSFVGMLTAVTFLASPTLVSPMEEARYFRVCLTRSFALGLLPLIGAGLLMRRGLAARPVIAGLMAGLGAGLIADAGWRLFCEVSDPGHVIAAHVGGIVAVALVGGLAGGTFGLRSRGRQEP